MKFFKGRNDFNGTQVDGAEGNPRFITGFDINLQRRLTIEINGDINYVAPSIHTIRRSVSPASG